MQTTRRGFIGRALALVGVGLVGPRLVKAHTHPAVTRYMIPSGMYGSRPATLFMSQRQLDQYIQYIECGSRRG